MAKAARSSGRASTSEPFRARPIGVRAAEMMTASDKGVLSCQLATDDQFLDLARSLVQGCDTRVPEVLPDRELVNVAVAAVHLDRGIRRPDRRLARVVLGDRRLERMPGPGVGGQRSLPGEQASGVRLDGDLRQQLLHELERGDGTAELAALGGVGETGLEAALADADAAGREGDPALVQRGERHFHAASLLSEHVLGGDTHAIECQLAGVLRAQPELALDLVRREAWR